jgi:hypothetical protein
VTSTGRDEAAAALSSLDRRPRRLLAGLELATGAAAVTGGLLLTIAPDGSLLAADPAVLSGSPFTDYRLPGVLLATLVGGGYLLTGAREWQAGRGARGLSICAGVGLVVFEAAEVLWLGFQPLEAVFAAVGGAVVALALLPGRTPVAGRTVSTYLPHLLATLCRERRTQSSIFSTEPKTPAPGRSADR